MGGLTQLHSSFERNSYIKSWENARYFLSVSCHAIFCLAVGKFTRRVCLVRYPEPESIDERSVRSSQGLSGNCSLAKSLLSDGNHALTSFLFFFLSQ